MRLGGPVRAAWRPTPSGRGSAVKRQSGRLFSAILWKCTGSMTVRMRRPRRSGRVPAAIRCRLTRCSRCWQPRRAALDWRRELVMARTVLCLATCLALVTGCGADAHPNLASTDACAGLGAEACAANAACRAYWGTPVVCAMSSPDTPTAQFLACETLGPGLQDLCGQLVSCAENPATGERFLLGTTCHPIKWRGVGLPADCCLTVTSDGKGGWWTDASFCIEGVKTGAPCSGDCGGGSAAACWATAFCGFFARPARPTNWWRSVARCAACARAVTVGA